MEESGQKFETRGVMNRMRQQTHIILWLLVFSFVGLIVFEWGMNILGLRSPTSQGIILNVNGTEVSYQQYMQNVRNQYVQLQQQLGTAPDNQYMKLVENQVFDNLINEILINEALEELNLFVTDADVLEEIRYNPRPEFLNSPEFQKEDGTFDAAKYQSILSQIAQSNSPDLAFLEQDARSRIPRKKLQSLLAGTIRITEEEIKQAFLEEEQDVTVEYIVAPKSLFAETPITVTDEEITAYYRSHVDDFHEEETRQLRVVLFDTTPTREDSAVVDSKIADALSRAKKGEDFAALSQEYTNSDGDLGTFGKGTMVPQFEEALFNRNIKKGDIIGPMETPFGKHIVKIERLVKTRGKIDSVEAKHILFTYEASSSTVEGAESKARYFIMHAEEYGFDAAAEEAHVNIQELPPIPNRGFIPGFGSVPEINDFTFRTKFDSDNPPISEPIETARGFAVFQLSAVNKSHTKTLADSDVRSEIEKIIQAEQRTLLAQNLIARIKADIETGAPFAEAAAKEDLEVHSPDPFKINDYIPDVGVDQKFTAAAFGLEPGEISVPVTGSNGVYLIKLLEKEPFNEDLYATRKRQIAKKLLTDKQSSIFNAWIQQLRDKATIKDFRDEFYLR